MIKRAIFLRSTSELADVEILVVRYSPIADTKP